MEYNTNRNDVDVYIKDVKVLTLSNMFALDGFEYKICYCPYCFKSVTLIREKDNNFAFQEEFSNTVGYYTNLEIKTEDDFYLHVSQCINPFKKAGIYSSYRKIVQHIVSELSHFSMIESKWDCTVTNSEILKEDCKAFLYIKQDIPVGFISFYPCNIKDYGFRMVLWEVYVLPTFRKRGIASQLLHTSISRLKIRHDEIFVKPPITDDGRYFLNKNDTIYKFLRIR